MLPLSLSFVTIIALIFCQWLGYNVGRARARHKIMPPAISGPPEFERVWRVQQNTLEQLALFLPSMWICGLIWPAPDIAAGLGALWIVARIAYARGYYADARRRMAGFVASVTVTSFLMLGALAGIIWKLFTQ